MYKFWKIGKHTFPSSSVDRRGQWCQGIVRHNWTQSVIVEQEQSQSWEGHRDPPQGSGAEPRDEHQSCCCCPRTTCNGEFAQGNRERRFFISHPFLDVPTNLSLSSSKAERKVSRQQQENPSKQSARLGDRFFFHTELFLRRDIPHNRISSWTRAPFPWDPAASSCSQPLH